MKFIYVYDPLCGWCYGFSGTITQLYEKYSKKAEFEVISGGMVTGERVGPLGNFAQYIQNSIPRLSEMTGVVFGEKYYQNILFNTNYISNSMRPCVALTYLKSLYPEKQVMFAKAIQYQLFHDGIDQNSDEFYRTLAEKFSLDAKELIEKTKSEIWEKETQKEFEMSASLQVTGFPALFLVYQNQYYQIAKGFAPFHQVNEIVRKIAGNVD